MRFTIAAIVGSAIACTASAQVITNGSMTGPVGASAVPSPWFLWNKTPDTANESGPFNNGPTDWNLSPDGGTFVRAAGDDDINSEAFAQNVSGYTPGLTYSVEFWQSNLGHVNGSTGDWIGQDGYWEILIDGVVTAQSPTLSKPIAETDGNVWSYAVISFVAPASDIEIAFRAEASTGPGLAAYMGIDGMSTRLVPAPGAIALLGFGAFAARRRR